MTHQVLARKWRPKSFATLVGQEHVSLALSNALDQNRLHHAYLFTGTRGVGKTTIARILAKCLNCEVGISSTPCDRCDHCLAIDSGRFVDLLEVDAASRTKVEDTRDLLENVQYAPASGRFKVYLIDEVHMLSGHSFNALLKTLEEPPPHVKFLLATTDPQKLPITILSRCLQFHLKNLLPELIEQQLAKVLTAEQIKFETPALQHLARAADGSMRDGLSLLDQAISFGNGVVQTRTVQQMLGTIEKTHLDLIFTALAKQDAQALLVISQNLAEQAADFQQVLEALLSELHQFAVMHATQTWDEHSLAKLFNKADIQLFYQIALLGRRDLPLAPTAKIGFEMTLLRMLDFQPSATIQRPEISETKIATPKSVSTNTEMQTLAKAPNEIKIPAPSKDWSKIIEQLNLKGSMLNLAMNCELANISEEHIQLALAEPHAPLMTPQQQQRLETALNTYFNKTLQLRIQLRPEAEVQSPARALQIKQQVKKQQAEAALQADPAISSLLASFNATVDNSSIISVTPVTFED